MIRFEFVMGRLGRLAIILAIAATMVGCRQRLETDYGPSDGGVGTQSINGFATLRQRFRDDGWQTQDVYRLNERLESLDALVWTPSTVLADDIAGLFWLQGWLSQRPRTLVYVIPDGGSEVDYWRLARRSAPPDQRVEYRRRAARGLAKRLNGEPSRGRPTPDSIDRLWFRGLRRAHAEPIWDVFAETIPQTQTTLASQWQALLEEDSAAIKPAPDERVPADRLRYEPLPPQIDHRPLAVKIESREATDRASTALGSSQVIVVAGGSWLTNFALARPDEPLGRELAAEIIAHSADRAGSETGRIGFLLTGVDSVPISNADEVRPPVSTGMELLTTWPLSLVTLHLAFMGIVACLVLLPIFGRPTRLDRRSPNDFADHIKAVAVLMRRTGIETTARIQISDYFRQVRGETSGPWVLPETLAVNPDSPLPKKPDSLAKEPDPFRENPAQASREFL